MKCYATKYNIGRTLLSMDINVPDLDVAVITDTILDKQLYLSKIDKASLKTLHLFLENPEYFMKTYFRGWKDTVKFLVEEPPAYHKNHECEWFKKDFFNIEIPEIVKERGLTDEVRVWAKANKSLFTNDKIDTAVLCFIDFFNNKHNLNLNIDIVKSVFGDNSGSQSIVNQLDKITEHIESLILSMHSSYSERTLSHLSSCYPEFKFNDTYKQYPLHVEYKIFCDVKNIRLQYYLPMRKHLKDYVFAKLCSKLEYESNVLDLLNFRTCEAPGCR
jgi:hypothetical protein